MSGAEDTYLFGYDYAASTRLALLHYLKRDLFGFLIHSDIPVPSSAHIADIATGNGIWLVDLGKRLDSSVSLHGFDINTSMAPAAGWVAPNVSFRRYNFFDEPPPDTVGVYDIVHVHAISTILRDSNVSLFIANMYKFLKPGGYLQVEDGDAGGAFVLEMSGAVATPALNEACNFAQRHGVPAVGASYQKQYIKLLHQAGFVDAARLDFGEAEMKASPSNPKLECDQILMSFGEAADLINGGSEKAEIKSFLSRAQAEIKQGAALLFPWYAIIARKPIP